MPVYEKLRNYNLRPPRAFQAFPAQPEEQALPEIVNLNHGDPGTGFASQDRCIGRGADLSNESGLQVVARRDPGAFYLTALRRILPVIVCFDGVAVAIVQFQNGIGQWI